MSTNEKLSPGMVLGRYELLLPIAQGGMATVWAARQKGSRGFQKTVAIKTMLPTLSEDEQFEKMFLDEAALAAKIHHPNVAEILDLGEQDEIIYLVMEWVDGEALSVIQKSARKNQTQLPQRIAVRIVMQACAGLHAAHELKDENDVPLELVHRDVSPQNILVTYDGIVKLVDFGVAKAVGRAGGETTAGQLKGKVPYMSPEQARGLRVDRRTDVFAVGVMLWEAIVGRRMWKGVPDMGVIHGLMQGELPSLRAAVPDVPADLEAIVARALARDPEARFATAADMQHAIEAHIATRAERPTARDVGKFVAATFAEDRAKVKALIESQLRDVRWSGSYQRATATDLPKIEAAQGLVTPTTSRRPRETSTPSLTASALTNEVTRVPEPPAPKPPRPVLLFVVAAAAAAVAVFAGFRLLTPPASPQGAPTASALASSAPTPARETAGATAEPAPGQDAVKVTIRVSPPDAKIYLDGVLLSAGAFEGKLVKSAAPRKLRAEAPRHVAKEETVTLASDVMVSFALEKEAGKDAPPPAPAGPARPKATAAAEAQPPPAPAPAQTQTPLAPGQKPKRKIDSDSPYSQ